MELSVLVGPQGAGKSSCYRERFAATHAHVSKDDFAHDGRPARRQARLVEQALAAGRDVVVDNTHAAREGKARVPDVARFATAKRLVAPSLADGLDALHAVRIGPAGVAVRPLPAATHSATRARAEASS